MPSHADALDPSEVSSSLAKLKLVGHVLACPACRTEALCELPIGITALACKGCEAHFFAQVPPPKEKRQPGRKQPSHHAPRPASASARLRPPTEYNLFQRTERQRILSAAPSGMSSRAALSAVTAAWTEQRKAREAEAAEEQPAERPRRSRRPQAEPEPEPEPEPEVPCCSRGHPLQPQRARRRYGVLLCDCSQTCCISPGDCIYSCLQDECRDDGGFDMCSHCWEGEAEADAGAGDGEAEAEGEEVGAAGQMDADVDAEFDEFEQGIPGGDDLFEDDQLVAAPDYEEMQMVEPAAVGGGESEAAAVLHAMQQRGRVRRDTGMAAGFPSDSADVSGSGERPDPVPPGSAEKAAAQGGRSLRQRRASARGLFRVNFSE